jgi:hypothetical protein
VGELSHQPRRLRKEIEQMFETLYKVWLDTPKSGEILYYAGLEKHLAEAAVRDFKSMAFEARLEEFQMPARKAN